MTETRKQVASIAGKSAALLQSPCLQLLQQEEIIRAGQRKIAAEIEGLCANLRQLMANPKICRSDLPRWQTLQKNLQQLLRNSTYRAHSEFRFIAGKFIALDLAKTTSNED
jgi:hypothetical protein